MSQKKRTIWDDIAELGRELIEQLDDVINPEKRRKPARVPVPVRPDYPQRDDKHHYR